MSPIGLLPIYPGGYVLGGEHWLTADSPHVKDFGMIYIKGSGSQFHSQNVRITGSWVEVKNTKDSVDYPYINVMVDSIWIVQ